VPNQQPCEARVRGEFNDRMEDIGKLWKLYQDNPDASDYELGKFDEYGLCFDYVAIGTFKDQKRGYFRWQLSWVGPADEFRFYVDEHFDPVEIEYWFLDWFDGASLTLSGRDYDLLEEIFNDFKSLGCVQAEYLKAI